MIEDGRSRRDEEFLSGATPEPMLDGRNGRKSWIHGEAERGASTGGRICAAADILRTRTPGPATGCHACSTRGAPCSPLPAAHSLARRHSPGADSGGADRDVTAPWDTTVHREGRR